MGYGELTLGPVYTGVNYKTGQFMKGHKPHNTGKRWSDYLSESAQKRCMKSLASHRKGRPRPDVSARCRKPIVALFDDGKWTLFPHSIAAAKWAGGNRENIGRCCRMNMAKKVLRDTHGRCTGKVNTDYRYKGVRWYFESDDTWTEKIRN